MLLNSLSLSQTAADLKTNKIDLIDFINRICDRIDNYEAEIHSLLPENNRRKRLINEARELVVRFPKTSRRPPFFGIPVGVKDILRVDGFPTKAGSKLPAKLFEGEEASCITKLKNAGALILGKTISTEFAYFRPGPTRNPHNTQHTPGGSSSGSAAAVAAGFCPLSLGTQTIGSITRPASYCGVIGFKPSFGRIPFDGVIPFSPAADHIGFFSQDIAGIEIAASILCDNWMKANIQDKKPILAIPVGKYLEQVSEEILNKFCKQISQFEKLGFQIKKVKILDDIKKINALHQTMISYEMAKVHQNWFSQYKELYSQSTSEFILKGQNVTEPEVSEAQNEQIILRNNLEQRQKKEKFDLWISPASTTDAPIGLKSTGSPLMNLPWTFAGVPTITIPAGISKKRLPIGLQCSASFAEDEKMLGFVIKIKENMERQLVPR